MNLKETPKCAYCGNPATHMLKNGKWCCEEISNKCPSIKSKNSLAHKKLHQEGRYYNWNHRIGKFSLRPIWNKGLTKETDERLLKMGRTYSEGCKSGKIKPSFLGRKETAEHRKKISDSMKRLTQKVVNTILVSVGGIMNILGQKSGL